MKRLKLLLVVALAAIPLAEVQAGHPACDPKQPHRAPCEMKSCAQMGPDGKPNGHKCSSYCSKSCCGCGTACTVDYPGEGPNPDEGSPQ